MSTQTDPIPDSEDLFDRQNPVEAAALTVADQAVFRVPAPVRVEAFRWRLMTSGGYPARYAVLATDRLRQAVVHGLDTSTDPQDFLLGGHRASEQTRARWGRHAHAHWLWDEADGWVNDLMLWVPAGLTDPQVRRVLAVTRLPRWPVEPAGYRGGELHLQQVGPAEVVLRHLGYSVVSDAWASATPLLTTWHCKPRQDWGQLMADYLAKELRHRFGADAPRPVALELTEQTDHFTRRWDEAMPSHQAFQVDLLQLDRPVPGILCLGALSHFGFGRLAPL